MRKSKLFVAVIGAVAAFSLSACSGNTPESKVKDYYMLLSNGKILAAKGYLSEKVIMKFGNTRVNSALEVESQRISKCGGIKSVTATLNGNGNVRTGKAIITYAKCPRKEEQTGLVKENGVWKINQ